MGECVGDGEAVLAVDAVGGGHGDDEVAGDEPCALVEELEIGVLAVDAFFAEDDAAGGVARRLRLQRGIADAVSFPFTYAHGAYKLQEVASWFTGNLKPGTADCPIVLNKTSYESLPDQYKDLLASLKPEVDEVYREVYGKADEKYLPIFQEALTEVTYDPATRQEFQNVAGEPIWRQWVSDNQESFDSQGVLDTVLNAGSGS